LNEPENFSQWAGGAPRREIELLGLSEDDSRNLSATPYGVKSHVGSAYPTRRRERWWLHVLLFLLTGFTTTLAGAWMAGSDPLAFVPFRLSIDALATGLSFSVPLLAILLGHELGHYVVALRRRMDVSPPFFLPAPPWISLVGTFGAFIRLRSPVPNRAVLLDIGVAGPLASLALSLPAVWLGLLWSPVAPVPAGAVPTLFALPFGGEPLWLGGSLLFSGMAHAIVGPGQVVVLHPLAFAGWLGLFVTMLNLLPVSQLDGGHILYALFGPMQRWIGLVTLIGLVLLGNPWWGGWWGWWVWASLVLLVGRGRVHHPMVWDAQTEVAGPRRLIGWLAVLILLLTFTRVPFKL
jgi:membrane-associated protease RseP (regulator of RpoE activity)